jgi:hypothetical protein
MNTSESCERAVIVKEAFRVRVNLVASDWDASQLSCSRHAEQDGLKSTFRTA